MNKETTPVVSVIIPVYNVEPYLRRCLDSIQAQTFEGFEAILVDDGSPDNSGAICDAYDRADHRFMVIHQPNAGVSAARNAGINAAQGKYICFIDADDEVLPNCLDLLVAGATDDVGLVSAPFIKYVNDVIIPETEVSKAKTLTRDQFVRKVGHHKQRNESRYVVTKLFDASIIKNNHIQFDSQYTYREDFVFMYTYLFHCDKPVACIADPVYIYYRRSDGAAMSQLNVYTPRSKSYFYASEKILEMAKEHQQSFITMFHLKNDLAKSYLHIKRLMDKTGREELKAESKELYERLVSHLSPLVLLLTKISEIRRTIRR